MPVDPRPYDAVLLVSFGGPERPDDVLPFLRNVTRGRAIPAERLTEVAAHYFAFGGRSPINDQCRRLVAAMSEEFAARGLDLPIYWGNRNWVPYLTEAVRQMAADGIDRATCFVTSAYSSYAGCRQYREDLYDAAVAAGPSAPRLDRLRHYFNHPGFVSPFVDATVAALGELPARVRDQARLVFVTHSLPVSMAAASGPDGHRYTAQHEEVADLVAAGVADRTGRQRGWDLVYCSRSGPPQVPWLEPDVNDHLQRLADAGTAAAVLIPIGFVSDHMEVVHDLDTEARATARGLGLPMTRAATPGTHPAFVAMIADLVLERAAAERGEPVHRPALGSGGAAWDLCPNGCCANPRGPRPALGEPRCVTPVQ